MNDVLRRLAYGLKVARGEDDPRRLRDMQRDQKYYGIGGPRKRGTFTVGKDDKVTGGLPSV